MSNPTTNQFMPRCAVAALTLSLVLCFPPKVNCSDNEESKYSEEEESKLKQQQQQNNNNNNNNNNINVVQPQNNNNNNVNVNNEKPNVWKRKNKAKKLFLAKKPTHYFLYKNKKVFWPKGPFELTQKEIGFNPFIKNLNDPILSYRNIFYRRKETGVLPYLYQLRRLEQKILLNRENAIKAAITNDKSIKDIGEKECEDRLFQGYGYDRGIQYIRLVGRLAHLSIVIAKLENKGRAQQENDILLDIFAVWKKRVEYDKTLYEIRNYGGKKYDISNYSGIKILEKMTNLEQKNYKNKQKKNVHFYLNKILNKIKKSHLVEYTVSDLIFMHNEKGLKRTRRELDKKYLINKNKWSQNTLDTVKKTSGFDHSKTPFFNKQNVPNYDVYLIDFEKINLNKLNARSNILQETSIKKNNFVDKKTIEIMDYQWCLNHICAEKKIICDLKDYLIENTNYDDNIFKNMSDAILERIRYGRDGIHRLLWEAQVSYREKLDYLTGVVYNENIAYNHSFVCMDKLYQEESNLGLSIVGEVSNVGSLSNYVASINASWDRGNGFLSTQYEFPYKGYEDPSFNASKGQGINGSKKGKPKPKDNNNSQTRSNISTNNNTIPDEQLNNNNNNNNVNTNNNNINVVQPQNTNNNNSLLNGGGGDDDGDRNSDFTSVDSSDEIFYDNLSNFSNLYRPTSGKIEYWRNNAAIQRKFRAMALYRMVWGEVLAKLTKQLSVGSLDAEVEAKRYLVYYFTNMFQKGYLSAREAFLDTLDNEFIDTNNLTWNKKLECASNYYVVEILKIHRNGVFNVRTIEKSENENEKYIYKDVKIHVPKMNHRIDKINKIKKSFIPKIGIEHQDNTDFRSITKSMSWRALSQNDKWQFSQCVAFRDEQLQGRDELMLPKVSLGFGVGLDVLATPYRVPKSKLGFTVDSNYYLKRSMLSNIDTFEKLDNIAYDTTSFMGVSLALFVILSGMLSSTIENFEKAFKALPYFKVSSLSVVPLLLSFIFYNTMQKVSIISYAPVFFSLLFGSILKAIIFGGYYYLYQEDAEDVFDKLSMFLDPLKVLVAVLLPPIVTYYTYWYTCYLWGWPLFLSSTFFLFMYAFNGYVGFSYINYKREIKEENSKGFTEKLWDDTLNIWSWMTQKAKENAKKE